MSQFEERAKQSLKRVGLELADDDRNAAFHTEMPFTAEDRNYAELAFYLGDIFSDIQDRESYDNDPVMVYGEYLYKESTPLDVWARIARALRSKDLCISKRNGAKTVQKE